MDEDTDLIAHMAATLMAGYISGYAASNGGRVGYFLREETTKDMVAMAREIYTEALAQARDNDNRPGIEAVMGATTEVVHK